MIKERERQQQGKKEKVNRERERDHDRESERELHTCVPVYEHGRSLNVGKDEGVVATVII